MDVHRHRACIHGSQIWRERVEARTYHWIEYRQNAGINGVVVVLGALCAMHMVGGRG